MEVLVGGSALLEVATKADLDERMDRLGRLLERPHANFQILHGGKAPRASNLPFVLRVEPTRPRGGHLWLVQWAWLTGDDPTVSAAIANTKGALLKGAIPPDASLAQSGAVWGGLDIPGVLLPGMVIPTPNAITLPDKMVVFDHEDVYFVLAGSGLVAGAANYHGSVGVLELPQTPEALMW